MADMAMVFMGGELKRAEKLSARYGDLLSYLYIGSSVLKFFEEGKCDKAEWPIVQWVCEDLLFKMQTQLDGILLNFPNLFFAKLFRYTIIFPRGKYLRPPTDRLGTKVAKLLTEPSAFRERMAANLYNTPNNNNPAAQISSILEQAIAVEPIEKRLTAARREYPLESKTYAEWIDTATQHKVISVEEATLVKAAYAAKMNVINVDDFAADAFG